MKLAAVDIGSNAIRLQISSVIFYQKEILFKKLEYVRFPLRLGQDVFTIKKISEEKEIRFMKVMHTSKLLMDIFDVDDYMICATSAMREAENGQIIANKVKEEFGVKINIIDGYKEAEMITRAIFSYLDDKTYLHIDVGGGSTELTLYYKRKKIVSNSFNLGSVRRLEHLDSPAVWEEIRTWIEENVNKKYKNVIAIGTGGNISKLLELSKNQLISIIKEKTISLTKLEEIQEFVGKYTVEERMNILQLNPDRADVILPASEIYITAMRWTHAKKMIVPDLGLKDGMIQVLYEKNVARLGD